MKGPLHVMGKAGYVLPFPFFSADERMSVESLCASPERGIYQWTNKILLRCFLSLVKSYKKWGSNGLFASSWLEARTWSRKFTIARSPEMSISSHKKSLRTPKNTAASKMPQDSWLKISKQARHGLAITWLSSSNP